MNELEKQFEITEQMVKPSADVRQAFIEMLKLLKLMYHYMEDQKDDLND